MSKKIILAIEEHADIILRFREGAVFEGDIKKAVMAVIPIVQATQGLIPSESEVATAINKLEEKYNITMDTGTLLSEGKYQKWYHSSKVERGTKHWDKYYDYLLNEIKLPRNVIDKLDEATEDIMDVLGDPKSDSEFKRKGLVIGAVQSGKTSNYTALINKAADSGYKVIILLTGTIEKLRRQTQVRIDEGFVGMDSRDQNNDKKKPLGVGKFGEDTIVTSFTTAVQDFNTKISMDLTALNGTAIFVIKKNKSVIDRLSTWLKSKNVTNSLGTIEHPMLLIDDEADNASINTNDPDKDPTAINKGIRKLLKLFPQNSYVGFTATPFANIFIDPQLDKETKDDLFPKDFIYLLNQPSNYVGPYEMYGSDGAYNYMIRKNDDMEEILPLGHKNGTVISELPESLKLSIKLFLISNALRDLRGQGKKHRSMLIHVSRFISVQKVVMDLVNDYFKELKVDIKNYAESDVEHETMKSLRLLFEYEYKENKYENKPIDETWDDVKQVLYEAINPIRVRTINSSGASKGLNYDDNEEHGLRLIAVGGLSLARGLTLEGLTISYFYRNTKMYDTLMQMGRWFGYREGYVDLCRLWTSSESAEWYEHISEATEDLKEQIERMADDNRTPEDFGLMVRSSEDTPLIVTARAKMKHTEEIKLLQQLNGRMIETPILNSNIDDVIANNKVIEDWIKENSEYIYKNTSNLVKKVPTLKNVSKESVLKLLNLIEFPYMNDFSANSPFISKISKDNSAMLEKWDIAIASNQNGVPAKFAQFEIYPVERSFDFFGSNNYIRISGSKKRLGSTTYALSGMESNQAKPISDKVGKLLDVKSKEKGRTVAATENMYFNTGEERNPLIVIYPVRLISPSQSNPENQRITDYANKMSEHLNVGISIGIPEVDGEKTITYEYRVNKVYQQELLGLIDGRDEEFDEDC